MSESAVHISNRTSASAAGDGLTSAVVDEGSAAAGLERLPTPLAAAGGFERLPTPLGKALNLS